MSLLIILIVQKDKGTDTKVKLMLSQIKHISGKDIDKNVSVMYHLEIKWLI